MPSLSSILKKMIWSKGVFEFWQKLGVHVTRNHYYSPIPDTSVLRGRGDLWDRKMAIPGITIDLERQLHFAEDVLSRYRSEWRFSVDKTANPSCFYLNNAEFGLEDSAVLYSMIRYYKPESIVEIGSGNSTLLAAIACLKNKEDCSVSKLTSIEPYPRQYLKDGFAGLDSHITSKVEEMDISFFKQLKENDILFIDSSHVFQIGNDIQYLYLEVLPQLAKGVIVHVHDIFLPYHYPREWVVKNRVFWNEQYLLQAFLCQNPCYEVILSNYALSRDHSEKMNALIPRPEGYLNRTLSTSFWIKRIA